MIPEKLRSIADASSTPSREEDSGAVPQRLRWWLLGMVSVGVAGDSLLRVTPWGFNLAGWVLFIGVFVLGLFRHERERMSRAQGAWFVTAVLFGLLFSWRDSPALRLLNGLAMMGALGMAFWLAGVGRINVGGLVITCLRMVGGVVLPVVGAFQVIGKWMSRSATVSRLGESGVWVRSFRFILGLVITVPIFAVFASLFASADTVFRDLIKTFFDFDISDLVAHGFFIAFFTWLAAGVFFWLWPRETTEDGTSEPAAPSLLGGIETGVLLTALNGLFLVFIIIQMKYLFGGNSLVQSTANLSYAEYFRSGFFELLAVAALVLPLLLICDWAWKEGESQRLFRQLATCLLVQLGVVMLSAGKRLVLYLEAYGLTEQRLYAAAVLLWLAFAAVWLGLTVLRGRRPVYAPGIAMAALVMIFALNVFNPDARITEHQLSRKDAGKNWDLNYLLRLSADAAPVFTVNLSKFDDTEKERILERVVNRWTKGTDDWRTSNWSSWQAAQWKAESQELLKDVPVHAEKRSRASDGSIR
ncbi:MAG: hypothetical protein K0Q55_856 [Verrucomicrobia bacterium]|jgi:hypothetical protein|nr:hypothetical protein [Verrucomicrobiota bacterium]